MERLSRRRFIGITTATAAGLALQAVLPESTDAQQAGCRIRVTINDKYPDGTNATGEKWEVRSMGQTRQLTVNRQGAAEITEEVGGRRVTRPYAELVGTSDTTFNRQPAARVQIEDKDPKDKDRPIAENVIPCGQERTANVTTARKPAAQAATVTPAAQRTPTPVAEPTVIPDARAHETAIAQVFEQGYATATAQSLQASATETAIVSQATATATAAEARRTPVTEAPRRQEDGVNWGGLLSIGAIIGASTLALLRLRAVRMRRSREREEAEAKAQTPATRPPFLGRRFQVPPTNKDIV